ncbi:hypothetical protein ScPMuIL_008208 [Solemya velum]
MSTYLQTSRYKKNEREIVNKSERIVDLKGPVVKITNPEDGEEKEFQFDQCYWSHDGFQVSGDGYIEPLIPEYADQKKIFNDLGLGMLRNAWSGYNCTLLAYGQTGSGKSYSVMGYGPNKGIVPLMCQALFREIEESNKIHNGSVSYEVNFSMFEIYNEQVRDLLNKRTMPKGGLPVRQHPVHGFYVEGLNIVPVGSEYDVGLRIEEGTKNRTLAATKMNVSSSRAHTIITITFSQRFVEDNMTKQSRINLVDLAGSERAKQSGATGDRFQESKAINKSLLTLGNVIKSKSIQKQITVCTVSPPYRNSKLTMLLQNALGGNSKTVMIATISPAREHYEQTLSTLKYADRAKSIQNKAVVNKAKTDILIKELLDEKEKLLDKLNNATQAAGYTKEEIERLRKEKQLEIRRFKEEIKNVQKMWQNQLESTHKVMENMLAETRRGEEEKKKFPHLLNLNEDPALTGKVYHLIRSGIVGIGNNRTTPKPDIVLHGPSIYGQHGFLDNKRGEVFIKAEQGDAILVNGEELRTVGRPRRLHHLDRISFGTNNLFVFWHPGEANTMEQKEQDLVKIFDEAQREIARQNTRDVCKEGAMWLKEEVSALSPMVRDAGAMALQMNRDVQFQVALLSGKTLGQQSDLSEVTMKVGCVNEFLLTRNDFINRYAVMREMYAMLEDGDPRWDISDKNQDPFWEPPETPTLIGSAFVPLVGVACMMDMDEKVSIYSYTADQSGFLDVAIVPCSANGGDLEEELEIEDPADMIGMDINFKIRIICAANLPKRFISSWCEYKLLDSEEKVVTGERSGQNPTYNFVYQHRRKHVTQRFLSYLQDDALAIQVWGRQGQTTHDEACMVTMTTVPPLSLTSELPVTEREKELHKEIDKLKSDLLYAENKLERIEEVVKSKKKTVLVCW